jgi:hypothetical protein
VRFKFRFESAQTVTIAGRPRQTVKWASGDMSERTGADDSLAAVDKCRILCGRTQTARCRIVTQNITQVGWCRKQELLWTGLLSCHSLDSSLMACCPLITSTARYNLLSWMSGKTIVSALFRTHLVFTCNVFVCKFHNFLNVELELTSHELNRLSLVEREWKSIYLWSRLLASSSCDGPIIKTVCYWKWRLSVFSFCERCK